MASHCPNPDPSDWTLINALLADADEHHEAGRAIQAANAQAAAENLKMLPPWSDLPVKDYRVESFTVEYGIRSMGWAHVPSRPYVQAEAWMNERAKEGFVLDRYVTLSPQQVDVIMMRQTDG